MEEPYELVLKTYQLKDIFLSSGISLNLKECEILLKSGFCQCISRRVRKYINRKYIEDKQITALLAITGKCLFLEFSLFQRKSHFIEAFTYADLMPVANTVLYMIEYVASLMFLSEKIDRVNNSSEIKEEFFNLTLSGPLESLMFLDIFLKKELSDELKVLSVTESAFTINKVLYNLLNLIETASATESEVLKHEEFFIDKFIKDSSEIEVSEIKKNIPDMVKSLRDISLFLLNIMDEYDGKETSRKLSIFNFVYVSLNLFFIALEEMEKFFSRGNLSELITSIQILYTASSCVTFMLDRPEGLFQTEEIEMIIKKFIGYFTGTCHREELFLLIEEEINNIYLKQEIEEHEIYSYIIRDYKRAIELLDEEKKGDFFRSLPLFLKAKNRLKFI